MKFHKTLFDNIPDSMFFIKQEANNNCHFRYYLYTPLLFVVQCILLYYLVIKEIITFFRGF